MERKRDYMSACAGIMRNTLHSPNKTINKCVSVWRCYSELLVVKPPSLFHYPLVLQSPSLLPSLPLFQTACLEKVSVWLRFWPSWIVNNSDTLTHIHTQFPQFPLEDKVSVCLSHARTHPQQTDRAGESPMRAETCYSCLQRGPLRPHEVCVSVCNPCLSERQEWVTSSLFVCIGRDGERAVGRWREEKVGGLLPTLCTI